MLDPEYKTRALAKALDAAVEIARALACAGRAPQEPDSGHLTAAVGLLLTMEIVDLQHTLPTLAGAIKPDDEVPQ